MSQQTVTINGTVYDAHTGMPVEKLTGASEVKSLPAFPAPNTTHSQSVHQTTQKSQTLNRAAVKKTTPKHMEMTRTAVKRSPSITKFAPHPTGVTPIKRPVSDIGPMNHPFALKAQQHTTPQGSTVAHTTSPAPKPSQVIKQEAIAKALDQAPSHKAGSHQIKKGPRHPRFFSIASASLALLLLGGYFTYLNMPSLSVRVAAAQAGVNASYPEYRPDGYSLKGPVAYNQGEVAMKFASNGGPQHFSITQTKSNWDSSALEENYIREASDDGYVPYIERGLKIYIFDNNAAWVNGGVLYKITGDAPLSSDQIRRIATSM